MASPLILSYHYSREKHTKKVLVIVHHNFLCLPHMAKRMREEEEEPINKTLVDWIFGLSICSDEVFQHLLELNKEDDIYELLVNKLQIKCLPSLFHPVGRCRGTNVFNLALTCKAVFRVFSILISRYFTFRCKSDNQYQYYSPTCVTIVHDSLPLIPSSTTKLHFLVPTKYDLSLKSNNKINQLTIFPTKERMNNLPPNLTHLIITSIITDYSHSFPPSLTHLTFHLLSIGKYGNLSLPPSLIFLKMISNDMKLVTLPSLPPSLNYLWITSNLNPPFISSLPPSLTHFFFEVSLLTHSLPSFPSSLQVLYLSCRFTSELPPLPSSLLYLILPMLTIRHSLSLPPSLIYVKDPPISDATFLLPPFLKYLHLSKQSIIPSTFPPSLSHLHISYPSSPLPSFITHLTINDCKSNYVIPSSVTHLCIDGGTCPTLPSFITHLTLNSEKPLPPILPSSLLYLSVNFHEQQFPPLPPNLLHLFISRFFLSLPPLPSSLLSLVWKTSFYPHQKKSPSLYPPIPIFPPLLQNLQLPYFTQSSPPQTMVEETTVQQKEAKEGKEGKEVRIGLPRRLMVLSCGSEWFRTYGVQEHVPPQCYVNFV